MGLPGDPMSKLLARVHHPILREWFRRPLSHNAEELDLLNSDN